MISTQTSSLNNEKKHITRMRNSAQRIIEWWRTLAGRKYAFCIAAALWALVSLPPALFHGYHYLEGLTVSIARSALADGNWVTPHIFNLRWVERPTLLPAIIAAISLPFGQVSPFLARLPIVLSLLIGMWLIWRALKHVASPEASVFGAVLFLACPLVMRYYVTSVADMPLAVILFSAFLVWWNAYAEGEISIRRWLAIGIILAVAALMKGPQPVAFFGLGMMSFMVLTSTWWQLPGFVLACVVAAIPSACWYAYVFLPGDQHEWLRYTRLSSSTFEWPHPLANGIDFFVETIPAISLACVLFLADSNASERTLPRHFLLALSCFAFSCTVLILLWPAEVNPRYVLPMVLPLCVLGGIAFDTLSERWPILIASSVCLMSALLGYAVVHSMNDLVATPAYNRSKFAGREIDELVRAAPAPVYRTDWGAGLNEFSYVSSSVTTIAPSAISAISRPAWLAVSATDAPPLIAKGNGRIRSLLTFGQTMLLKLD